MPLGVGPAPPDPGGPEPGPGPSNKRDGINTDRTFPLWGDKSGDYGKLIVLRLEATNGTLPRKPFLIRKSVEAFLGGKLNDGYPEGRGTSYTLKVRNAKQAEKLRTMETLSDGTMVKIINHPTQNISRCVINCPESTEYKSEELLEELKDQGVTDLRRITKRLGNDVVNTPTIILTIDGTVIPESIYFGWIRVRTRPYYPTPMLCYACFEYGHPKARCPAQKATCGNCSKDHPNTLENPCTEQVFCKHCNANSIKQEMPGVHQGDRNPEDPC